MREGSIELCRRERLDPRAFDIYAQSGTGGAFGPLLASLYRLCVAVDSCGDGSSDDVSGVARKL